MKTQTTSALLGLGLFAALSGSVVAQTTWTGATDLNWSTATNWSSGTAPSTGNTALINDTAANRTIVYDTAASGALGTLTLTETSAFVNALDIKKDLTIASAVTLSAATGGTSLINVDAVGSNRAVTFTNGLTINSGGTLDLTFGYQSGSASWAPTVGGNVTLNGGTISVGQSQGTSTVTATFGLNSATMTINSGTILVNNSTNITNSGYSRDVRISVYGNFTATGGSLVTTDTALNGSFQLNGQTNSFSNFSFAPNYGLSLGRSGDQSLSGAPTLSANLNLRGSGIKTISGTTVGPMGFWGSGADLGLTLGSNLTLNSGANMLAMVGGGTGSNLLKVNANGKILDMSLGSTTVTLANGTSGVWKPNASTGTATWALTSSSAGGVIKAKGFDFTAVNTTVTVGPNLTLAATGGNGIATNLGTGTAFDPTSTFAYTGTAGMATPATLVSGRAIGALLVSSGALKVTGATFDAAGGITVASGAVLDFTTTALTAPTTTLLVNNASAGQIKTNGFTNAGDLTVNFSAYDGITTSYSLFNNATAATGDFTHVSITGTFVASLTRAGSVWGGSASGQTFSFDETNGLLTMTSAIPEPSTYAVLAGALVLGLAVVRRNRRA